MFDFYEIWKICRVYVQDSPPVYAIPLDYITANADRAAAYEIAAPMLEPFNDGAIYFIDDGPDGPQRWRFMNEYVSLTFQRTNVSSSLLLREVIRNPQGIITLANQHQRAPTMDHLMAYSPVELQTIKMHLTNRHLGIINDDTEIIQAINTGAVLAGTPLSQINGALGMRKYEYELFENNLLMTPEDWHMDNIQRHIRIDRRYEIAAVTCTTLLRDGFASGAAISANAVIPEKLVITQAPTSARSFWIMMWQLGLPTRSASIVCLDSYHVFAGSTPAERLVKARQYVNGTLSFSTPPSMSKYWPHRTAGRQPGLKHAFGKLSVRDVVDVYLVEEAIVSLPIGATLIRSTFSVMRPPSTDAHTIVRYWFYDWPDHGVVDARVLTQLLQYINSQVQILDGPIVVHCNAGVGRSGVFASCWCMDKILSEYFAQPHSDNDPTICIPRFITELRCRRPGIITTQEQYCLCYEYVALWYQEHKHSLESRKQAAASSSTTTTMTPTYATVSTTTTSSPPRKKPMTSTTTSTTPAPTTTRNVHEISFTLGEPIGLAADAWWTTHRLPESVPLKIVLLNLVESWTQTQTQSVIDNPRTQLLKYAFLPNTPVTDVVTKESFINGCLIFGKLWEYDTVLLAIKIINSNWYHPTTTAQTTELTLHTAHANIDPKPGSQGYIIVRPSSNAKVSPFSVSVFWNNTKAIWHSKINRTTRGLGTSLGIADGTGTGDDYTEGVDLPDLIHKICQFAELPRVIATQPIDCEPGKSEIYVPFAVANLGTDIAVEVIIRRPSTTTAGILDVFRRKIKVTIPNAVTTLGLIVLSCSNEDTMWLREKGVFQVNGHLMSRFETVARDLYQKPKHIHLL
jgi:hypothetical protein